ncbi:MAG TPA: T9SS type A sorting domain-containing protein, partial [Chitinophagaceae bacterium]|nr:T9SS type A sorting domain-containing protein [Chitinophagaceae bacterium]
ACLEVNMNTGTGTLNHLFPGNPYDPRIEAFGLYDPSRGVKWTIVARENMQKIMLYTGPGTGYHCNPSQYNPASGMTQEYPTIAAGIGPAWGGNIGNEQYSYAWGDPSKGRYLAQALNFWGDPINPDNASIVNNTYCTSMPSDPSDIISMSNSCNTGLGTVVAWNEGNKIFYKFLGNTYQFRPTGIEQVKSLPDFEIYPNPAADNFQLSLGNSSDKFAISIASLDGKVVLTQDGSGKVAKVDVSKLVPGVYFVEVSNEASRSVQRLVKK